MRNTWPGRFRAGSRGWERVIRFAAFAAVNAVVRFDAEGFNVFSVQITKGSGDIFGANTWIGWLEGLEMGGGGARTVINEGAVGSTVCEAGEANAIVHGEAGCKATEVREAGDGVRELEGSVSP